MMDEFFSLTAIPEVRVVSLLYFLAYNAHGCLEPFLSVFLQSRGLSMKQVGLFSTLPPISICIFSPLWTRFADRTGKPTKVLLVVVAMAALAPLLPLLFPPGWLFAAVLAMSALRAPLVPLLDSCAVVCLSRFGGREAYGKLRVWGAVGYGISALLAGRLLDIPWLGFGTMALLHAFFHLALFAAILLLPIQAEKMEKHNSAHLTPIAGQEYSSIWSLLRLDILFLSFSSMTIGISAYVITTYLFIYLSLVLEGSRTMMGAATIVATLGEIPAFFFAPSLLRLLGTTGALILAQTAFVVRLLLCAVIPSALWVLPVQLLHGLSFSLAWSALVVHVSKKAPPGLDSTAQGLLYAMFVGVGHSAGAALGGLAYAALGPVGLFVCTASLMSVNLLVSVLEYTLSRRTKVSKRSDDYKL